MNINQNMFKQILILKENKINKVLLIYVVLYAYRGVTPGKEVILRHDFTAKNKKNRISQIQTLFIIYKCFVYKLFNNFVLISLILIRLA